MLDAAINLGIASKAGAWFSYGEERLGQGRVNVENMLKENKELYERLERDVLEAIRPKNKENEQENPEDIENDQIQNDENCELENNED